MFSINVLYTEQLHSVPFAYKFCLPNNACWLCLCRRRRAKRQSVTLACEKLGERLFEARDRAGLTLRELGQRSGVSWSSISAIEKGRQSATVETIERIALALGVRTIAAWAVALLLFFPLGWMVLTSFKTELQAISVPPLVFFEPTLENFSIVQERSDYMLYAKNALITSIASTISPSPRISPTHFVGRGQRRQASAAARATSR